MAKAKLTGDAPTVADRVREFFAGDDEAHWPQLRQLVESGEAEAAAAWVDRHGYARDVLQIVAIVVERRAALLAEYEAGEKGKERRPVVVAELEALRRFTPQTIADATEAAEAIRKRERELNDLLNVVGRGDAAGYVLKGIHQQFGELFDLPGARHVDAGCPNEIDVWFRARGLSFYQLGSWKLKVTAPQVEAKPRRRLKAIFTSN